jgi:hypothetical protein
MLIKATQPNLIDNLVRLLYSTLELKKSCELFSVMAETEGDFNLALFLRQVENEETLVANQIREKLHSLTGWKAENQ